MRYDHEKGALVFSSGRVEENMGAGSIVGIDMDDLSLSWGYDSKLLIPDEPFTAAERRELADWMIALWQRFAAGAG